MVVAESFSTDECCGNYLLSTGVLQRICRSIFNSLWFCPDCLEKGITKHTIGFRCSVKVTDAFVEGDLVDQPGLQGRVTDTLDHRGEGVFCEAFNEVGSAGVYIDHSRRNTDRGESRFFHERIEPSSDHRIPSGPPLEFDLALYRLAGGVAVRVKVCRSMITFDDSDGTADLYEAPENGQGVIGPGKMFQDMAYKDMVKRCRLEVQIENISLEELNIAKAFGFHGPFGFGKRLLGYVDRDERCIRAVAGERNGLSAHSAAGFQNSTPGGIGGVGMEELDQRIGLILQAPGFPRVIPMYILHISITPDFNLSNRWIGGDFLSFPLIPSFVILREIFAHSDALKL